MFLALETMNGIYQILIYGFYLCYPSQKGAQAFGPGRFKQRDMMARSLFLPLLDAGMVE